jgi:hemolysin activation/secretion protein
VFVVKRFVVSGSRVFSQADIDEATKAYLGRELTFSELLQVADVITQLYVSKGYMTTGAYVPAEAVIQDGIVPVTVVEGGIAASDIHVRFKDGTKHRLDPDYIRSRIALASQPPLNRQRLLDALQLLKLNPLIQDLKAELQTGTHPGQSILDVEVVEGRTFSANVLLDNGRSPSVGSFRRQIQISDINVLGFGDSLLASYSNTEGSNAGDLSYTFPINPHNGTLSLNLGISGSTVIESPFDVLNIESRSRYLELTYRQPIIQTPTHELALGITVSHQYSHATLIDGEIPFPSRGSDFEGKTQITALRLFQEWTQRSERSLLALRSQFSIGLGILGATENEEPPDGEFLAWRGQAQWIHLLAADTPLLLRGDIQLADRALVPLEQFGLGGQTSVRGYRQDAILSDSGLFVSAEVRIPLLRLPKMNGLLQLAPFVDVGTTWNLSNSPNPDPSTLASVGFGLRFQLGDRLNARFDWGIPLVTIQGEKRTWQEEGLHLSFVYTLF